MIPGKTKNQHRRIGNLLQRMNNSETAFAREYMKKEGIESHRYNGNSCITKEEADKVIDALEQWQGRNTEGGFVGAVAPKALPARPIVRYYRIEKQRPQQGMCVILFLMDGTIISTKWNNETDQAAKDANLFLKGRYPILWAYKADVDALLEWENMRLKYNGTEGYKP